MRRDQLGSSTAEGDGYLADHAKRSASHDAPTLIEADFVSVVVDDTAGVAPAVDSTGTLIAGGVAAE